MDRNLYGWEGILRVPDTKTEPSLDGGKKLSIVIPSMNQGATIEDTILSIVNQDYNNYEIIVIDGGSRDETPRVIEKYRDWVDIFVSEIDEGQSEAINKGFRLASGNIHAWINSDDYYLPGAFREAMEIFNRTDKVDVIVGGGTIVNRESEYLKNIDSMVMDRKNLLEWEKGRWIMQQSCFWTSDIWKKSGGVDESLHLLMDYDLWLRFAELGRSRVIEKQLAVMRYYPEVKTVSMRGKMNEEIAYVYAKNRAYDELRRMVNRLVEKHTELENLLDADRRKLSHRIIRRVGL